MVYGIIFVVLQAIVSFGLSFCSRVIILPLGILFTIMYQIAGFVLLGKAKVREIKGWGVFIVCLAVVAQIILLLCLLTQEYLGAMGLMSILSILGIVFLANAFNQGKNY